jgi:uncharacterized OB-fold protein
MDAKFCPQCGHQQVIFEKCDACGKNITPGANFCPRCGNRIQKKPLEKICPKCGARSLSDSVYCNSCGEKH